jgi:hypothetical protein
MKCPRGCGELAFKELGPSKTIFRERWAGFVVDEVPNPNHFAMNILTCPTCGWWKPCDHDGKVCE